VWYVSCRLWVLWYQFKSTQEKALLSMNFITRPTTMNRDALPGMGEEGVTVEITGEKRTSSIRKSHKTSYSAKETWYLDRPYLISDRFLYKTIGVKAAVEYLVLISPLFYNARETWEETLGDPGALCPSFWQWQLWAFLTVLGYDALGMLYASWRFSAFGSWLLLCRARLFVPVAPVSSCL